MVDTESIDKKIDFCLDAKRSAELPLGELYETMFKDKGWKGRADSWESYLAGKGTTPRVADELRRIYRVYIEQLGCEYSGLSGIDKTVLTMLVNHVDQSNLEEWLSKAQHLSRTDIRTELKHGGKDQMTCPHKHTKLTEPRYRCQDCGAVSNFPLGAGNENN